MNRKSYSPHERPFYQAPILLFLSLAILDIWQILYPSNIGNIKIIRKNCLNSNKVCNKVQSTYLSISRQQKLAYLFLKTGFTKPRD